MTNNISTADWENHFKDLFKNRKLAPCQLSQNLSPEIDEILNKEITSLEINDVIKNM